MVGVSSSPPGSHASSSTVWRLICSTLERRALAVSTASAMASPSDPSCAAAASGSGTISATLYGRRSPITATEPISGLAAFSVLSMFAGDMFLPAALMISSFLRSTIDR